MNTQTITPVVPPPVAVAEDQPQCAGTEPVVTNTAVVPVPVELALENLSVNELKAELTDSWSKYRGAAEKEMAPLLYHLRERLKSQGTTGAGFGAWVEDNLDISRRTADRWANDYAVVKGLKKPPKPKKATFRHVSKSLASNPDGKATVSVQLALPADEALEFQAAMEMLGAEATEIIRDAVISAARDLKKPAESVGTQQVAAERTGDGQ